jgi:hypothetical protein
MVSCCLAIDFANASEKSLDAEKANIGKFVAHAREERPISAAKVELDWPFSGEYFIALQPPEPVFRVKFVR